ncbi:MAG TPA: manganese efflux pump [Clostridiales bacterium]|jgi:putative Mn2+ efflux pump MntP|nr:manganese efflux pump [Clostridiales bacterium]
MGQIELIGIALALSMDAFAVSVCKGLGMKKINYSQALTIGLFFGGFQALMPLLGWLLGSRFESYIRAFDHWVAFGLLAFIGGKMIVDLLRGKDDDCACCQKLDYRELLYMAVATSIDALTVGITFAFFEINVWRATVVIGLVTMTLCVAGVALGCKFGAKFKRGATLAGGVVLVLIGIKILLEGYGILAF